MSLGLPYANPYEVTALQIAAARVQSVFRSRHRQTLHQQLELSDLLLDHVERCRVEGRSYVPLAIWQETARLARLVDPKLREALANNRHPNQLGDILFELQDRLLQAVRSERGRLAPVIPLFPSR